MSKSPLGFEGCCALIAYHLNMKLPFVKFSDSHELPQIKRKVNGYLLALVLVLACCDTKAESLMLTTLMPNIDTLACQCYE